TEHDVIYDLVPGVVEGDWIETGTSGVSGSGFNAPPVPLRGGLVLTIGKKRAGQIPLVVKSKLLKFDAIAVLGQACGCVHGSSVKSCGGTYREPDGLSFSKDCTRDDSLCAGLKPCTFIHGPGNTASGVVGCDGLDGTDLDFTLDAGGETGMVGDPVLQ